MDFEKIKMMGKHSAAMKPIMDIYNERWMPMLPQVESKDHPQHSTYIYATNNVTTIFNTLLKMIQKGEL